MFPLIAAGKAFEFPFDIYVHKILCLFHKNKTPRKVSFGARNYSFAIKNPKTNFVFGALTTKQTQSGLLPSFIRTLTVGCGITPHHALFVALVGCTTDREFTCAIYQLWWMEYRCHPAPKVKHSIRKDYTAIS
jgi:hypothetical protein